jgi:hypothetical protein
MDIKRVNLHRPQQFYHLNTAKVRRMQTKPMPYTQKNYELDVKPSGIKEKEFDLKMFEQYNRDFCKMEIEAFEAIYRIKLSPEAKEKLIKQMLYKK